jgi:cytidylate kinase
MAAKVNTRNATSRAFVLHKPETGELLARYLSVWKRNESALIGSTSLPETRSELPPCITISRKTGVGVLEIADILAHKLGYALADRTLIEQIASQADISEKAITFFDERFPGYADRTFKFLFGEKAFIDSDYARYLVKAVLALAGSEPTVFVGRGAHLILPRDGVLAVRCICSDDYRAKRMAEMLGISEATALKKLKGIDKEQAAFFKKVFGKKEAAAYEFDVVLNLDHFADCNDAVEIIALAFSLKYKTMAGQTGDRISA